MERVPTAIYGSICHITGKQRSTGAPVLTSVIGGDGGLDTPKSVVYSCVRKMIQYFIRGTPYVDRSQI